MKLNYILLLLQLKIISGNNMTDERKEIHILGLVPVGGTYWPAGNAMVSAIELALDIINDREDILPGYKLVIHYEDSQCDVGIGLNAMYSGLYAPPNKAMILGPGCSNVCYPTAEASHYWNVTQVSPSCLSPSLSDRSKYKRFFRIIAPGTAVNDVRVEIFQEFAWKHVAFMVQSSEAFKGGSDDLSQKMKANNMTVLTSEVFDSDPETQIENLVRKDARIIFLNAYEKPAIIAFCEIYKQNLYGPRVVWMINNWYSYKWWNGAEKFTDCTREQLEEALEGAIVLGFADSNPRESISIANLTSKGFKEMFSKVTDPTWTGLSYGAGTFDSVFACALALNDTQAKLKANGNEDRLNEFVYSDFEVADMIFDSMQEVNYVGIQGPIQFNENGDPAAITTIQQLRGGELHDVGLHLPVPGKSNGFLEWLNGGIQWNTDDGLPPKDVSSILIVRKVVPKSLYAVMCALSGIAILLAVLFLIFNVLFRKRRVIKMSSPNINNIILLGCIVIYTTVFIQEREHSFGYGFCLARVLSLTFGFSLVFGALFSKTWRIHVVLTSSSKLKKVTIRDSQLFVLVAVLVLINALVILVWQLIDPFEVQWQNVTREVSPKDDDVIIQSQISVCQSKYASYFTGTIYIIQGLMLVFGIFLAWETRKVKVEALNDSKLIASCIYNVVLFSVIGVAINVVLTHQVEAAYAFTSSFLIIPTTLIQCIIFIPKALAVKRNDEQIGPLTEFQASNDQSIPTVTSHGSNLPS